jgi:hypothetical protein
VIGLVLALIVAAIILALVGMWIWSIPVAVVAVALFVRFVVGWGRRAPPRSPDSLA